MEAEGLSAAAINAFSRNYGQLVRGECTMIPESAIEPVRDLPRLEDMHLSGEPAGARELLNRTVIIKLNGGLGTGMGLDRAKSLVMVREGRTFLDLIARQVLNLRERFEDEVRFLLMNSYATSEDTLRYLEKYGALGGKEDLELMQSRVPKIDVKTFLPVEYPEQPDLEWCPPGHGDLFPSLLGTGWLDLLLAKGVNYAFVSNSDNLGATLDLDLLSFFAASNNSLLMEVTPRTDADRKGGHLARRSRTGAFILRELVQCPEEDREDFVDTAKHPYFNTNSLWFRLDRLKEVLDANEGTMPLPMIRNAKTVNPRDEASQPVFQLETAMGSAIGCFADAGAIEVPRARFAPVKTTDDLFALRSDAYEITEDFRLQLVPARRGDPPVVHLDAAHYKLIDQLEESIADGVPSLAECRELTVRGPVRFSAGVSFKGSVVVENSSKQRRVLLPAMIADTTVVL